MIITLTFLLISYSLYRKYFSLLLHIRYIENIFLYCYPEYETISKSLCVNKHILKQSKWNIGYFKYRNGSVNNFHSTTLKQSKPKNDIFIIPKFHVD